MLKKETISKFAELLKLKVEDLTAALTDANEVDLTIPQVSVFTAEELTARDENIGKVKYNEGKTAGVEMGVKELKNELSLDFEGKDIKSLVSAVQKKTLEEAKIEPNKKVDELKSDIAKLQSTLATKDTEIANIQNQLKTTALNSKIVSMLPTNRATSLTDSEYLTLLSANYEIAEEDGKLVAKKGGEIVKNSTTQAPLEVKDVINDFFIEKNFVAKGGQGGQGGGNSGGNAGVITKLSELVKKFESEGKSTLGEEFQTAALEAQKSNPNFNMNE